MKLSDFLKNLFGAPSVDAVNNGVDKVKDAAEKKDLSGVLTGLNDVIVSGAKIIEKASLTMKAAGDPGMTGAEKHEAVKGAVLDAIEAPIKSAIPTPTGTTSDAFGLFIKTLLGGVVSILINAAVAKLNKNGWNI